MVQHTAAADHGGSVDRARQTTELSFDGPVVVLAVARSFSSVIGAVIGSHPQLYALPELHVWGSDTVADWEESTEGTRFTDGLLRAVAELRFGSQTPRTVAAAREWIRRRSSWPVRDLVDDLADMVSPRTLVEKSPSTVLAMDRMLRVEAAYPDTRYVHLVRHPVGQGASILKLIDEMGGSGREVRPWMEALAGVGEYARGPVADPTASWYAQNALILRFLSGIPRRRQLTLRGEEVLGEPELWCRLIADWLGARRDPAAVEAMLHPERSPYARVGPWGAPFGNDLNFLREPELRRGRVDLPAIDAPLPWADGAGLPAHVRGLAAWLGYR
jgi:hypothetical protein